MLDGSARSWRDGRRGIREGAEDFSGSGEHLSGGPICDAERFDVDASGEAKVVEHRTPVTEA
jgi:hypothetical protein